MSNNVKKILLVLLLLFFLVSCTDDVSPPDEENLQGEDNLPTENSGAAEYEKGMHYPPIPYPPDRDVMPCEDHDSSKYHALYDEAEDCHHDHEHHEDPNFMNDVFGSPAEWWATEEYPAQEISYPWQTFRGGNDDYEAPAGHDVMENALKHEGYGWYARKDMPCRQVNSDGCITDFRVQVHSVMGSMDAVVRFHSFSFEGKLCLPEKPKECGIYRTGGWIDFGYLYAGSEAMFEGRYVPLENDPEGKSNGMRLHNALGIDDDRGRDATWYGGSNTLEAIGVRQSAWGPIDPKNPGDEHFFCDDYDSCRMQNGAQAEAHLYAVRLDHNRFEVVDGKINFKGFTDRYGNINPDCSKTSIDCIPLEITNVPAVSGKENSYFQYRDDAVRGTSDFRDFDTSPQGEYWIKYPN